MDGNTGVRGAKTITLTPDVSFEPLYMKKLEKWLKQFLIFLIKLLIPGQSIDLKHDQWKNFNRILVFRLDNRFGNAILILSLIQAIKKSLPEASVDVLMTSSYVSLYKDHPAIQTVIPYDQKFLFKNPLRFFVLISRLRKNKYDAVFSSNNPDAFSVSQAIFNRLVTKNRSVGFDWKESHKLYTDVVSGNTKIHYAESQFELWKYFDTDASCTFPKVYFINKKSILPKRPLLLWLGATGNKILSEEMVESILESIKTLNVDYQMAAGPNDQHVKESYSKEWKLDIQIIDLNLSEIAKYFLSYKCIIIPDTGPMHLIAALDIPLVQIFVNSNIQQYGYSESNNYIVDNKLDVDSFLKFIRKYII